MPYNVESTEPFETTIVVRDLAQLTAVYALLGGVSPAAIISGSDSIAASPASKPSPTPAPSPAPEANPAEAANVSGEIDIDAGGHPWSEALHASTKTKTKDGYWRMKVGVSRPDPLPGFPKDGASGGSTGTSANGAASNAGTTATAANAGQADEDDEFAAFRKAAGNDTPATDVARKWTDADLGSLCNQAATKLGDPAPVKEVIAEYVPEGQVAHSRNVPEGDREAFAQAVEQVAGIKFAA